MKESWNIAQEKWICFRCLASGHEGRAWDHGMAWNWIPVEPVGAVADGGKNGDRGQRSRNLEFRQ